MKPGSNLSPEPTAASPSVCGRVRDPLLPRVVGTQSQAAVAQLRVSCESVYALRQV